MTTLHLKNTYSKSIEPFVPLDPEGRRVTIYSCGPTVYSYAHIGNFRTFLLADLLRRVLHRCGFVVRHVMNITDVGHMTQDHLADATGEDKLAKAARELGWDPYKVARHFEDAFVADAKLLRLVNYTGADADDQALHPRATRYVPEMLAMIQQLIERGYAYVDRQGQVYFEISRFPEYGRLSGKVLEELEAGARVAVKEDKRDPRDFALWKVDAKHLMQWDPHGAAGWPEGDYDRLRALVPKGVDRRIRPGFPGWHIECSAMARAQLGDAVDIHTGGEDNIFPHHECEIAQSYGALGLSTPGTEAEPEPRKTFVRYWLHARHLLVDNRKMSKRDGNFFTVRDLLDPRAAKRPDLAEKLEGLGFPGGRVAPNVLRYALLSNQYTQPMNFTFDLLVQAKASLERIQSRYDRLRELLGAARECGPGPGENRVSALVQRRRAEFDEALGDNLNVAAALAAVFMFVGEMNTMELTAAEAREGLVLLESFDEVLDVLDRSERSGVVPKERIAEWLKPEFLVQRAAALSGWAAQAGRAPILALLCEGRLPTEEGVRGLACVDGDAIELMLAVRQAARKAKDFAAADRVRELLKQRGVIIEDTPQGVRWKLA